MASVWHGVDAVVLMGTCGSGKSATANHLLPLLQSQGVWMLLEGDDFHPPANVAKMAGGSPLTDADRADWLLALNKAMLENKGNGVLTLAACSALKQRYRRTLAAGGLRVLFVLLDVSEEEVTRRMQARKGHFMPLGLIRSQFASLERPSDEEMAIALPEPTLGGAAAAICAAIGYDLPPASSS